MSEPRTNWNGRSLRCSSCLLVASMTIEGLCPDCYAETRRCDRCGTRNTDTRPFRLDGWDETGLDGVSRFCARCAVVASAGYHEAIA